MNAEPKVVESYVTPEGKAPFDDWVRQLEDKRADKRAIARIFQRIDRLRLGNFRLGNFGDCRSVGNGVYELRIHFSAGYRVYFGIANEQLVILLSGGDKSAQKKAILIAQKYWKDYKDNAN